MTGYDDGTFKPNKQLNRGDVTKALGKFVVARSGKSLDEYVADNNIASVPNFDDVPNDWVDSELLTFSKIVKEAGIFEGSDNKLMPTRLIKRDQMAEVLVRAFDFEDQPGKPDLVGVEGSGYAKSIEILYENGITDQLDFRPLSPTSRAQFASFLVRSYDATVEPPTEEPEEPAFVVKSVEAVSATVDANTDKQFATFTINDGEKADLAKLQEEGYTVEFLSTVTGLFVDKATGELDESKMKAGDEIRFEVNVSKDDKVLTSNKATLKVEDFASTIASLDSYELKLDNGQVVVGGTIVLDEKASIANVLGTTKAGEKEKQIPAGQLVFTSSNPQVVQVNDNGELTTVAPGSATITVKHEGSGEELTVPVKVKSEARVAATAKANVDKIGLLREQQRTFGFSVTDQYGMPFDEGETNKITGTMDVKDADGKTTIATVTVTKDDKAGQYVAEVVAKDLSETASGNVVIKAGEKELLSIPLTVGTDIEAESYRLELADGSQDTTLDVNPVAKDDNLTLVLNQYNKEGLLIGATEDVGDKYSVSTNNNNVTATVGDKGVITVETNDNTKTGTTVVSVKEGELLVDQITITVVNTTPAIKSIKFGADEVTTAPVKLSDLLDAENITLSSNANVDIELVKNVPTIYAETSTEADGYQAGQDILLGTVDIAATTGLGTLTFVEGGEDDTILLTGFEAGDKGNFTLRVRKDNQVLGTHIVNVKDVKMDQATTLQEFQGMVNNKEGVTGLDFTKDEDFKKATVEQIQAVSIAVQEAKPADLAILPSNVAELKEWVRSANLEAEEGEDGFVPENHKALVEAFQAIYGTAATETASN